MNFRICEGGTVRHQGKTYYPGDPLVLTNRRDAAALIQIGRIAPDPEADAAEEAKAEGEAKAEAVAEAAAAKVKAEALPPEPPTPPEPPPVPEPEADKAPAKPAAKK